MPTIHRGTILSFDPATWTAMILLDGADAEAQIPVGQWVPDSMMVANAEVAVILLDGFNTDAAVVLGPYGAVGGLGSASIVTFGGLNLGDGSGAVAGQLVSASSVQARAAIVLAGQEFYQAGHTDSAGIAVLVGVNRGGNRQLWLADSALLAQNTTNPAFRVELSGGLVLIGAVATDGATVLPLAVDNSALNLVNGSVLKVSGTQVTGSRRTGWAAWTGTPTRATKATSTATLTNVAEALKALIDDLISHGLIGT